MRVPKRLGIGREIEGHRILSVIPLERFYVRTTLNDTWDRFLEVDASGEVLGSSLNRRSDGADFVFGLFDSATDGR